jgi:protein N-terminal amidase
LTLSNRSSHCPPPDALLHHSIQPDKIDLLVLPEMALTGYTFTSLSDIQDLLEDSKTGRTATLCGELARRMKCWVIAGYPEGVRVEQEAGSDSEEDLSEEEDTGVSTTSTTTTTGDRNEATPVEDKLKGYNSAVIVSPTGQVVGSYRKSFLFETDKAWAEEGESEVLVIDL